MDFAAFDSDRNAVISQCRQLGVEQLICPGVSPQQWPKLDALAKRYEGVAYAVGIHPWFISSLADTPQAFSLAQYDDQLKNIVAGQLRCVAIGECGLDAKIDVPLALQQEVLEWHCHQAQALQLPLIVHCVKAHNEMLQCLNNFPEVKGVIHAFSGSIELAENYWQRGFLLGVGGTITYERASKTRSSLSAMPLESLLLETDAPDMPLQGQQGHRNSPVNLVAIAQQLAQLRGISVEAVAEATSRNAKGLFGRLS